MPCPQQKFNILLASSAVALIAWQYVSQRRLQRLLAHEVEKREADYKGRIRSQQKAREQAEVLKDQRIAMAGGLACACDDCEEDDADPQRGHSDGRMVLGVA